MTRFSTTIYNCHLFEGTVVGLSASQIYKDVKRRTAIGHHIAGTKPDIVGLSEVWASSYEDDMINAAALHGFQGFFYQSPNVVKLNPGLVTLAQGQLQNPMGFSPYTDLVGWDSMAAKGVINGKAMINGHEIHIVQTHTQATYTGSENRDETARRKGIFNTLFPVLDTVLQGTNNPVLLLGDLNIVAGSTEYHWFDRQMRGRGMQDAWTAVHSNSPGYTYVPSQNVLAKRFAPTESKSQRLDCIYFRNHGLIEQTAAKVLQWKTPKGIDVSDHYGLRVDFASG